MEESPQVRVLPGARIFAPMNEFAFRSLAPFRAYVKARYGDKELLISFERVESFVQQYKNYKKTEFRYHTLVMVEHPVGDRGDTTLETIHRATITRAIYAACAEVLPDHLIVPVDEFVAATASRKDKLLALVENLNRSDDEETLFP